MVKFLRNVRKIMTDVRYTPHVERQTLAKFNVRWLHFFLWKRQKGLKLDLIWIIQWGVENTECN